MCVYVCAHVCVCVYVCGDGSVCERAWQIDSASDSSSRVSQPVRCACIVYAHWSKRRGMVVWVDARAVT